MIKHFSASGYISGAAGQDVGCQITGLTVFPGTVDGTVKVDQGINGADDVVIPVFNVIKDLTPFHIPIYPRIYSSKRTYITLTGTALEVLVQYG